MIKIFKKFFRFSGEHRRAWYLSVVLEFLRCIAEAIQFFPLFLVLLHLVDGTMTPAVAWTALGLVALSVALQAVLHYFSHKLEMRACYLMLDDKRISIGERMKYMPMGYFNDRSLGNLTAICTSTMEDLESMAGAIVVRILAGVLHALVFSLGFMIIDWRIGLIFLAGVVAMLLVNSRMLAMSRKYSPERLAAQMRLVDAVLEYIQGMSVIKAFSLSGRAGTSIEDTIDETERQNFKLEKKSIPYTIAQQVVLRLFAVAAIAASIVFFLGGTMSLFVCLLMVIGGFLVYGQLEGAGSLSFMLPMVEASIDRVEEADSAPYMDERGTVRSAPGHAIEFAHASFSYGERTVIDDVSLSIPERTSCAIVGPSGSGKTTLVNLMARFWDVDAGTVSLGGEDVRDWKLDELMAHFAMVFQDVYLFNDTIENNIKFGRPDATHEQVVAAARAARCHDFVEALPEGYATMLGEGGATVSGGEKQRISIARALLKDAPIVLLDEATANVDPENEDELQAAIEELTRRKTVVMIAHRLKTVRHADQILVLDGGRIVQRGTHDELMAEGGIYEDFVRMREKALGWKVGGAMGPALVGTIGERRFCMAQVQTTKGAPRGAKREIEQKAGIGVRDLVTVAVFSVIYFIIFFACGCLGFVPVMAFLFPLPLALVSGIPQMLFYTKVRSFGMVTIMGALLGLLAFLMGYGPIGLGFGIVFGLIADLILRAGAYKSTRCAVAAHAAFSLWVVGTMLPMWILGQAYFEPFRSSQGDAYVNEMLGLLSGGMLAVVVIGIVACAVVGALVGRAVLKKHFERAGIA